MKLLQDFNGDGMTIIMVTHSETCARYARRLMRISDGSIVEDSLLRGTHLAN